LSLVRMPIPKADWSDLGESKKFYYRRRLRNTRFVKRQA
jgi:hypothetical protein